MNAWDMRQDCEAIASFKPSLPTGSTERSRIIFKTNRTCFFWWAGKSLFLGNPFLKIFFTVAGASQLQDIYFQCQPEWEIIWNTFPSGVPRVSVYLKNSAYFPLELLKSRHCGLICLGQQNAAMSSKRLQYIPHYLFVFFIKVFANMKKCLRCVQLLCVQIQSFGLLGIANQKTTRGPALRRPNCFKSWHVSRFQWKFGISVGVEMSMHRMNKIDAF